MPVLGRVAAPCYLDIHHVPLRDDLHDLLVDLRVVLEGIQLGGVMRSSQIALMITCSRVYLMGATGISNTTWGVLVRKAFMARNFPSSV